MKRTRRIEVVRYTRRVTIVQGDGATADAEESPPIDVTPGARGAPPSEQEASRPEVGETVENKTPRRRTAFRLCNLLRLCRRGQKKEVR